jgi:hypothetical protein
MTRGDIFVTHAEEAAEAVSAPSAATPSTLQSYHFRACRKDLRIFGLKVAPLR